MQVTKTHKKVLERQKTGNLNEKKECKKDIKM